MVHGGGLSRRSGHPYPFHHGIFSYRLGCQVTTNLGASLCNNEKVESEHLCKLCNVAMVMGNNKFHRLGDIFV